MRTIEYFHHNGKKIMITNIPTDSNKQMSYQTMLKLQKLIDRIESLHKPKELYSLTQ